MKKVVAKRHAISKKRSSTLEEVIAKLCKIPGMKEEIEKAEAELRAARVKQGHDK